MTDRSPRPSQAALGLSEEVCQLAMNVDIGSTICFARFSGKETFRCLGAEEPKVREVRCEPMMKSTLCHETLFSHFAEYCQFRHPNLGSDFIQVSENPTSD
ncbi:hypothetical protein PDE_04956 [Penicillium oxalicum 114-2]|uniref:Uncharacterized protein n=1 Tax=Penicillium oxalicum (strain 114-2 / CGMCC 5302) TaxID=933388 RepID=S7ZMU3_PENO1|nr:hypothetical protein PDE_04956 [Penicillium oxalicum 114-2]